MAAPNKNQSYQQMHDELESLISWFESDKVNLDEALEKYEAAMRLLKRMEDYLNTAENKIKKIELNFGGE